MRMTLILAGLVLSTSVAADVYRSVDESGNLVYSDQPSPGAERVDLQEVQTIEPPPPPTMEFGSRKEEPTEFYTRVAVTSPGNEESVRSNDGNITISVAVEPRLAGSDQVVLYLDGAEAASGSGKFTLENLDRGAHQLRAVVRGPQGEVRKSSETTTFHLLRHSRLHPNPPPAKPKPGG